MIETMSIHQAIALLQNYQEWQRFTGEPFDEVPAALPDPDDLDRAIDSVLHHFRTEE